MSQNLRNPSARLNSLPINQRLAVLYTAGRNQQARKTVDQTVISSAVLVNDTELGIYLASAPKTAYYFRLTAQLAIAAAANNIRYSFVGGDGLVLDGNFSRWVGMLFLTGVAPQVDPNQVTLVAAVTGGTTNAWTTLIVEGCLRPEQPGYFGFQFAQNVSGATNTTVKAGSTLMAWEISA